MTQYDTDFLIVGSGFGGSVSAHRLTQKGYTVMVIESGKRWRAEDFPRTNWQAHKFYWRPRLGLKGFFNLTPFRHVAVLSGHAVGGGSITYANTLLRPPESVWRTGTWAGLSDWHAEMPQHFDEAERMLGVTENRLPGTADRMLREMAQHEGVGDTWQPTRVATFFPPAGETGGKTYPDPYFNGEGPDRGTCTGCGGCMTGCRYNAKNTLDKNYLYFAEKQGAKILAETSVVDIRPLPQAPDGSAGYQVTTESSTSRLRKCRRIFLARHVIVAASSLGTQNLLFRLKHNGSLPDLPDSLGTQVRTNAESIIGVRFPGKDIDMSEGVAIGSGIHLDPYTHVEATRYGNGHDLNSFLTTLMVGGRGKRRIAHWLRAIIRHPLQFARITNPRGWARQTLILLVMQTLDSTLTMRWKRRRYWPFARRLTTEGERIPTNIPQANAFAEKMAERFGGVALTGYLEVFLDMPITAHCLGGCAIADSPEKGVVDAQHRVFNYQNLYVIDGSTVGANLGVNPSLTIAALAERAMGFIPPKPSPR